MMNATRKRGVIKYNLYTIYRNFTNSQKSFFR